jgi:hypothetical protein
VSKPSEDKKAIDIERLGRHGMGNQAFEGRAPVVASTKG